jgi:hypothetical protein
MSAIQKDNDPVGRAGSIIGRSRIATIADDVVVRSVASVRSSRALSIARRCLGEFQSLPSGERTRCALITLAAALAGHIVLAQMLPAAASPTLGLTTVALLGAALVAARSAK